MNNSKNQRVRFVVLFTKRLLAEDSEDFKLKVEWKISASCRLMHVTLQVYSSPSDHAGCDPDRSEDVPLNLLLIVASPL